MCRFDVDSPYIEAAAEVFGLLSDPTRIRIIVALRTGELPVHRLAELVAKSPTAVSQHLAKLRMGRMVTARREGNLIYYRLTDEHARTLVAQAVFQAEHVVDPRPTHHRVAMCPAPRAAADPAAPEPAAPAEPAESEPAPIEARA